MNRRTVFALSIVSLLACTQPVSSTAEPTPALSVGQATQPASPAPPQAMPAEWDDADVSQEAFPKGASTFAAVKATLLDSYYREGLTEDDLYRAATAGMVRELDPKMKKWNRLLSPRELTELQHDLKGEVVGIGAHIKFEPATGYAEVLAALPGSPAERAGIKTGDLIVSVGGKLYKGMKSADVVADIRGKAGEKVTLSILRGAKIETVTVERAAVVYDQPVQMTLPRGVGYLRIPSFNDKTPAAVRDALGAHEKARVTSLFLELRQDPGGSFERAVETAGMLLPAGAGIVRTKMRGKPEDKRVAPAGGVLLDVPIAVLVDGGTASSAELLTAALAEGRAARVVGAKTSGKWTVQSIDELSNGWALKYTISLFETPSGKSYEGVGLVPDVEIATDADKLARAAVITSPRERLEADVPLRTAAELVARP